MSGTKNGVPTNISKLEERAVYMHCYGHALNLAVGDTMKASKAMCDSLDTVYDMSKLIQFSPERDAKLELLKNEISPDTPGFHVLCPTRWTVGAASLRSVLDNYNILQSLWEDCYETMKDSETCARILGIQTQRQHFDFLFRISLGFEVLCHTDNLSKTLQHTDMSAAEGHGLTKLTLEILENLLKDKSYDTFWDKVTGLSDTLDVNEPTLPRRRKMPKRFESGNAPVKYPAMEKDIYRQIYYEALDHTTIWVRDRFNQPGYRTYRHFQDLILKYMIDDFTHLDDLAYVGSFYKSDTDKQLLITQLEVMKVHATNHNANLNKLTISVLGKMVGEMKPLPRQMFSEIITVLKLIQVTPTTNATSERSFYALRRVKTYLHTSMTQQHLSYLMVMYVHRDTTGNISLTEVANKFVSASESCQNIFDKF